MRISDWSSDVCSSDLGGLVTIVAGGAGGCVNAHVAHRADDYDFPDPVSIENLLEVGLEEGIGEVLHDHGFTVTRFDDRIDLRAFGIGCEEGRVLAGENVLAVDDTVTFRSEEHV